VVDSKVKLVAQTPTRLHEQKIPLSEMWSGSKLVRDRWRRSYPEVSLWLDQLFVSGTRGRDHADALRGACARCNDSIRGNQDSKVLNGSSKSSSPTYPYGGDSGKNWIKRKRNGITGSHSHGQRIARESCSTTRVVGRINLETDSDSTNITEG
jgi:hypothetical protein